MAYRMLSRLVSHTQFDNLLIVVKANCQGQRTLFHFGSRQSIQNGAKTLAVTATSIFQDKYNLNCVQRRRNYGKKGKKEKNQIDEEEEEEDEDVASLIKSKSAVIITPNTTSMRIDAIVKAGLGISRAKIEVALYESKIRVNNEKVLKKSHQVYINDVVDLIKGPSPKNDKFTMVNRITILHAGQNVDAIKLKLLREKNLIVDDYAGSYKLETAD